MQKFIQPILDYTNYLEEKIKNLEQENVETTNNLYELQTQIEELQRKVLTND
jgi:prefoldin subunit 5